MKSDHRAIIAMSGGVDSSVAAYLMLRDGFDCAGVTMKLFRGGDAEGHGCCTAADAEDARSVAYRLGIPFYVFNFAEEFRERVMDKFVREYEAGRTPNPCVDCNRFLKFGTLLRRADELGYDTVATGHYARIERGGGRYLLKKALDPEKDQSYVLYMLTQEQLARLRFPLGNYHKREVREIAAAQGFGNASKRDSQDICFVPDGDYPAFLERYTGKAYPPGEFVDLSGKPLGRHRGAVGYTLGQRRGLGVAAGERIYVLGKDMEKNTVTLGPEAALYTDTLLAEEMNWVSIPPPAAPLRARAKTRYRQAEQPATVTPLDGGSVRVVFDEPQRAITPGQAVVLYDGDVLLGGGTILYTETGR